MRKLGPRPVLTQATQAKLREKELEILAVAAGDARKQRARDTYNASRGTDWFAPIITGLRSLCGQGELCMYCSSNEPSQIEHFRPLSVFPEHAFDCANYLWSCDICNRTKGDHFPPTTKTGAPILNPLDDDVWEYFLIDAQFGRLICRIDPATGTRLPRAITTCEVVGIDHENVQIKRNRRFQNLQRDAVRALADFQSGTLDVPGLRQELAQWRSLPFQADGADFFLNGPGRSKEPFRSVLLAVGEAVP